MRPPWGRAVLAHLGFHARWRGVRYSGGVDALTCDEAMDPSGKRTPSYHPENCGKPTRTAENADLCQDHPNLRRDPACLFRHDTATRSVIQNLSEGDTNMAKDNAVQLPNRKLISTTKAAQYLDVTTGYIRQLVAEGRLRGYRVGRLVKVDANDVEALLVTIDNSYLLSEPAKAASL